MNRQAAFRFWATGTPRRLPALVPALAAAVAGVVAGCAALSKIGVREPTAAVKNVRLTSLSFDQLGLGVQIGVQNPNPVAVTLAGYDYQLSLGATPLLSGVQEQAVTVQRNAESVVEIPVTLVFAELFQTLQSLAEQDSTELGIAANLWCDLPVFGRTKLPIKATRRVPLLKLPSLTVEAVGAKMAGLTSAEIGLQVCVRNPNALGFNITQLKYALTLHDKVPANGVLE
ncbi:MAG: LEA type 2 family protein, partial [Candidatus Oleimicrobiaceae bacterium]